MAKKKELRNAMQWAQKVFEKRPINIFFVRVPRDCARTGCLGYHPTYVIYIDDNGGVFGVQVYGFHCRLVNTAPDYIGWGVDVLAEKAFELLKWVRQADPWAGYPKVGYRMGAYSLSKEIWLDE